MCVFENVCVVSACGEYVLCDGCVCGVMCFGVCGVCLVCGVSVCVCGAMRVCVSVCVW